MSKIKIHSAKTTEIKKWVKVFVTHKRKKIELHVVVVDGKVIPNVYTSYLKYFDQANQKSQSEHLKQITAYIKRYIK